MFLSTRELQSAIQSGALIINPPPDPARIGATSIDVHLDSVEQAQIWNLERITADNRQRGISDLEINIARMNYGGMSREYLMDPPYESSAGEDDKVVRRDRSIILRPGGFVLWQTKEEIGTPLDNAEYICFIDGKSTKARTGLVVHLTAPTIHATWSGNVTLEMTNCGPLHAVLHEGDVVAQVTVARITSSPQLGGQESATLGQSDVTGGAAN
ncbi:MAG: hypothetical protein GWP14_02045 [Actinobacteria bacterium]|nr:hypothetical protein [Actinomycetota bacterium]